MRRALAATAGLAVAAMLMTASAPRPGQAAASAHRYRVVFARTQPDGSPALMALSLDGRHARRLTRGTSDADPAPSPNGRRLAFTRFAGERSVTYVGGPDARHSRRLTSYIGASWSPSGTRIVVYDQFGDSGLYIVNVKTKGVVKIPGSDGASEPAWSRDGKWIAFERSHGAGSHAIEVTRPNGSETRVVTISPDALLSPSWSAGGRIAFMRSRLCSDRPCTSVEAVSSAGGQPIKLAGNAGWPAWSPDGRRITFVRRGAIWVMNASGSHQRQLTRLRDDLTPDWQRLR